MCTGAEGVESELPRAGSASKAQNRQRTATASLGVEQLSRGLRSKTQLQAGRRICATGRQSPGETQSGKSRTSTEASQSEAREDNEQQTRISYDLVE